MKIKLIIGSIVTAGILTLMFSGPREQLSLQTIMIHSVMPLLTIVLFWINYLWLASYYLFKNKKVVATLYNLIIIICFCTFLTYWHSYEFQKENELQLARLQMQGYIKADSLDHHPAGNAPMLHDEDMRDDDEMMHERGGRPPRPDVMRHDEGASPDSTMPHEMAAGHPDEDMRPPKEDEPEHMTGDRPTMKPDGLRRNKFFKKRGHQNIVISLRDCLNFIFAIIVAYYLKSTQHITKLQQLQQEAEVAQRDAELRNMRNQISPHFLLNTLNNIYALAGIDGARAQDAIMKLSKMLRHMLYDNQTEMVTLRSEVEFIQSYVELMRLRLAQNVKVETIFSIDESRSTMVAPLLFISLVENAFKHGVSSTEPCIISIQISENEDGSIVCDITNSNNPKTQSDRSGHGVGLELVQKRLDMVYPNRYSWIKGIGADGLYHSVIELRNPT